MDVFKIAVFFVLLCVSFAQESVDTVTDNDGESPPVRTIVDETSEIVGDINNNQENAGDDSLNSSTSTEVRSSTDTSTGKLANFHHEKKLKTISMGLELSLKDIEILY